MKILVICQYYYPEPFRINDICEELVKRGHDVTVVTGIPNYPMGKIYDGYEKGNKEDELINGVKVHRCRIIPRRTGVFYRILNYYSYSIKSSRYIKTLKNDFDLVFIYQLSPVMMASAGIKYAKKHKKKIILYCLDLWPESLVISGIKRKSIIYRFFNYKSKKIYKSADKIMVTSKSFIKYFEKQFGIKNVSYLPQYAENIFNPKVCEKKPNEFMDIMFAGNVGTAQNIDILVDVARRCADIKKIRWHIVGDGVELNHLKEISDGLPFYFYGRQPLNEMPKYYSMADVMVVTMKKDPIISLTLPGKVQSYMAAGKPIIGSIDGETKEIVTEAKCGFITESDNVEEFETIVRDFYRIDKRKIEQIGKYGRIYYEDNFKKEKFMDSIENIIKKLFMEEC